MKQAVHPQCLWAGWTLVSLSTGGRTTSALSLGAGGHSSVLQAPEKADHGGGSGAGGRSGSDRDGAGPLSQRATRGQAEPGAQEARPCWRLCCCILQFIRSSQQGVWHFHLLSGPPNCVDDPRAGRGQKLLGLQGRNFQEANPGDHRMSPR